MAVTENALSGINGTKKKFPFTFPYLKTTDLKVELVRTTTADGTKTTTTLDSTKFTFPTATEVELASTDGTNWQETSGAPKADGGGYTYSGKVYRSTASDKLAATFYPGSAIRSGDLNDNYTQNLYVTQEASNLVTNANTDSAAALTKATAAEADADASILATDAFVAKNTGTTSSPTWVVRGNAGTDSTGASDPQSGVGKAITDSASALAKALEAISDADAAVITADSAESAVSSVLPYTIKATATAVQALFGGSDSPTADDIFELTSTADLPDFIKGATWAQSTAYKVNDQVFVNSKLYRCTVAGTSHGSGTGPSHSSGTATDGSVTWIHEANSDGKWNITGKPDPMPTFSAGITVKLKYASGDATASTWAWQSYHANNPETRYAPTASPTLTSPTFLTSVDIDGATQIDATVTVGVDDTGYDVKFFGDTASAYLLWDTSADSLLTGGSATIDIVKDKLKIGGTAVTTTAAELNVLDGIPGTLTATELGYVDGVTSAIQTQLNAKPDLTDDQSWSGAQRGTIPTPATHSSGATYDFDMNAGNNFKLTIGAAVELGFSNIAAGQSGTIEIVNGAFTPTWGSECHFVGGTVIDLTQSVTSYLAYYSPSASAVVVKELLDVKAA